MNQLVVYGGAFNPPHLGHIHCVKTVQKYLNPDLVVLVPTSVAPHKRSDNFVSGSDRMAMCALACEGVKKVAIDSTELEKKGVSYTADTLRLLKEKYKPKELVLLMGQDMFLSFHTWHNYLEILKLATLCVIPREVNKEGHFTNKQKEKLEQLGAHILILKEKVLQVSSTEIRKRLQGGEDVSGLLSYEVTQYIKKHSLYGVKKER